MSRILKFDRTPVARLVSCAATFASAALVFEYLSHGASEFEPLPFLGLLLLFLGTLAAAAAAVVAILVIIGVVVSRHRVQRHRVFHPAPRPQAPATVQLGVVEQWSDQFRLLEATGRWADLHVLLGRVAKEHPDLYAKWQLSYLDARALIEMNEPAAAAQLLGPYLAPGNPLRDLALFHQAEISESATASRFRTALIFETPASIYRDEA